MALLSGDERELLLPLAEGLRDDPPWGTFLRRLAARTGADHVFACIERDERGPRPVMVLRSGRDPALRPDPAALGEAGLLPLAGLRPGRVYALQEHLETAPGPRRDHQRAVLKANAVRHARAVRTPWRDGLSACIVLFARQADFRASDSALLSALIPHITAAVGLLSLVHGLEQRAREAEAALARLGIGQVGLDRDGRVICADRAARDMLGDSAATGRRFEGIGDVALLPAEHGDVPEGIAAHTGETTGGDSADPRRFLTRPATGAGALALPIAAMAQLRGAARDNGNAAARVLRAEYGLSEREAALAVALSRGEGIVEAGTSLGLTAETARNYSKRIYAKTGTRGQADLVRLILTGLAVLA
ncbi:LuxR family transcriptional regulator [Novosphingobium sp. ZN18A2]|uniref:helix-turn-helix transcriptional regulator n=1 Tax=Novosphingobium sp. ZN18A2 TaxID=3079861 RepID=UPI0030D4D346